MDGNDYSHKINGRLIALSIVSSLFFIGATYKRLKVGM